VSRIKHISAAPGAANTFSMLDHLGVFATIIGKPPGDRPPEGMLGVRELNPEDNVWRDMKFETMGCPTTYARNGKGLVVIEGGRTRIRSTEAVRVHSTIEVIIFSQLIGRVETRLWNSL
jgi:hypothetical protein